jgi:tRNA threonylcarbamoyladenosine biosynthesis protein TsaB
MLYQNLRDRTTNSPHIIGIVRILAADTSSERGSVCIAEDGRVLGVVGLLSGAQHSDRLFRSLDFLFANVPFGLPEIDLFAAARGPGSFTGLRIGLAAMEGFAAANSKPSTGVSTLEALAWRSGTEDRLIAPTVDARRGEVYGALYRRTQDRLVEVQPPVVLAPERWLHSLPDEPVELCGDGAERYSFLCGGANRFLRRVDPFLAPAVAGLAMQGGGRLEPLYVRRTDAEVTRERHDESIAGPNTKGQKI